MVRMSVIAALAGGLFLGGSAFAATDAAVGTPEMRQSAAPQHSPQAAAGAEQGKIAWYGKKFTGRKTASGERFNPDALTMAHPSLPFGTMVRVTDAANGRSVVLRVNDRGPFTPGRIADVSLAAARKLGMIRSGVVQARLEVVGHEAASASHPRAATHKARMSAHTATNTANEVRQPARH